MGSFGLSFLQGPQVGFGAVSRGEGELLRSMGVMGGFECIGDVICSLDRFEWQPCLGTGWGFIGEVRQL